MGKQAPIQQRLPPVAPPPPPTAVRGQDPDDEPTPQPDVVRATPADPVDVDLGDMTAAQRKERERRRRRAGRPGTRRTPGGQRGLLEEAPVKKRDLKGLA